MCPVELSPNFVIDKKLVVGSASIERIFRLTGNQRHEADATLNIIPVEQTYGGSGICNAVATMRTRVLNDVMFASVAGEQNGEIDSEGAAIADYLQKKGIKTHFQLLPGHTEQSMIVLSGAENDQKRGFRTTGEDGSLLRDQFKVTPELLEKTAKYPLVVGSSFHPSVITSLAQGYSERRGPNNGLFVWTINKDSANVIRENQEVQQAMQTGSVDIMFMSDREFQTIAKTQEGQKSLDAVDTLVVTKGSEGCFVRSHLKSTTFEYTTPSFAKVTSVSNDNGAGETHHNNFLATFTAVHPELRGNADLKFKMDVIHTAARIGNLAAYIKIQQDQSLWFPDLDFSLIRDELVKGSKSPEDIAKLVHEEYRTGGGLH